MGRHRKEKKLCLVCNKPMKRKRNTFCSKKCSSLFVMEQSKKDFLKLDKRCLECNESLLYEKRHNRFCSSSCMAKHNNKGRTCNRKCKTFKEHPCEVCGALITYEKGHKAIYKNCCSHKCASIFRYNTFIERWLNGLETGCSGKTFHVAEPIRRYLLEKFNEKCQMCGWDKVNLITKKVPLTIHHINGDYKDNRLENLQLLCPNCHSLTPTYGALNKKGNGRRVNGHM